MTDIPQTSGNPRSRRACRRHPPSPQARHRRRHRDRPPFDRGQGRKPVTVTLDEWIEREFGWSDRTARNFMNAYALSLKSETVSDLKLPMRELYLVGGAEHARGSP